MSVFKLLRVNYEDFHSLGAEHKNWQFYAKSGIQMPHNGMHIPCTFLTKFSEFVGRSMIVSLLVAKLYVGSQNV